MTDGSLRNAGTNGHYWAETGYKAADFAYFYVFNLDTVYVSNHNPRWEGFTEWRCTYGNVWGTCIEVEEVYG